MAKKKRTAKRKTKPAKRRTAKRNVKVKVDRDEYRLGVPVGGFDTTPYLIAADQRKLTAAVRTTEGEVSPPLAQSAAATLAGTSDTAINPSILPAPYQSHQPSILTAQMER